MKFQFDEPQDSYELPIGAYSFLWAYPKGCIDIIPSGGSSGMCPSTVGNCQVCSEKVFKQMNDEDHFEIASGSAICLQGLNGSTGSPVVDTTFTCNFDSGVSSNPLAPCHVPSRLTSERTVRFYLVARYRKAGAFVVVRQRIIDAFDEFIRKPMGNEQNLKVSVVDGGIHTSALLESFDSDNTIEKALVFDALKNAPAGSSIKIFNPVMIGIYYTKAIEGANAQAFTQSERQINGESWVRGIVIHENALKDTYAHEIGHHLVDYEFDQNIRIPKSGASINHLAPNTAAAPDNSCPWSNVNYNCGPNIIPQLSGCGLKTDGHFNPITGADWPEDHIMHPTNTGQRKTHDPTLIITMRQILETGMFHTK